MVVDQRHDRPDAHALPVRPNFQTAAKLPYALSHAGHTDAKAGRTVPPRLPPAKTRSPAGERWGNPADRRRLRRFTLAHARGEAS